MTDPLLSVEERLAHLIRMMDDMSDVIARQDTEIARLRQQVDRLMHREAERQAEQPGGIVIGDERPPHY